MRPLGQIINLFPKTPVAVWKWETRELCPFDDCMILPRVSDEGKTRWVVNTHLGEEELFEGAYIVKKGAGAYFVMNLNQISAEFTLMSEVNARALSFNEDKAVNAKPAYAF
jgi:hypothetical protein